MTPGRLPLLTLVLLLLLVALGAAIVLLRPGRERPADVVPTRVLVTTTPIPNLTPLPASTVAASPSLGPTVEPTEALPRVTVTRVPPTATVAPTIVPPSATPTPERTPTQKG